MGCGSSVAVLPEHAITYDNEILDHHSKDVKSSESCDSGVGYELGSKENSSVDGDALPDIRHLAGPTFADRKPLPPHPFEATFTERSLPERFPPLRPPNEVNNEVENMLQPKDTAAELPEFVCEESSSAQKAFIEGLPRPPTPEFMISGQPLRPLRGMPVKAASSKKNDIITARNQSKRQINSGPGLPIAPGTPKGDRLLYDLHRSVDHDTQIAARPPSRGGLAFDLVFGEESELQDRVEKLKKRQKIKAPKSHRKVTRSQVQKKLIEAELRRQQQTLDTITKLSETHSNVDEVGQKTNRMEELKRIEMKRAQQEAMDKALAARKQHLEEMRDRIRAKNEKIKRANSERFGSRPPTSDGRKSSTQLPSLLGF